jgi:Kef-type K+ transport system membrane component KefB/predicted transcriptional regulator
MNEYHFGILLILGIGIFGGTLGAVFFQMVRIPQVLGYIAIGILIGRLGLDIVKPDDIETFSAFNWFALGVIGFLVGGELRSESFRKYGKRFVALALGEGLGAFVLVTIAVTAILYLVCHSLSLAFAAGIVFGAICSATDPASTVDVLWENRARGPLTAALIAIVALDDALAMTLYALGTSAGQVLTGSAHTSILHELVSVTIRLGSSLFLGFCAGLLLTLIVTRLNQKIERLLAMAIGIILLTVGLADFTGLDIILAAMAAGTTFINLAPGKSELLYQSVKRVSVPVYAMFFVLVGAGLSVSNMPVWLWAIVGAYAVFRSAGKMAGAYGAAKLTRADVVVQKYTGLGLFAQGGVAIGLSIVAGHHLSGTMITKEMSLGSMIVFGVTATTFIVQIAGPPMVKLAVRLAKEGGRDVTEVDIIESMTVSDVMDTEVVSVRDTEPLSNIIKLFSSHHLATYPVVDADNRLIGILTLDNIKGVLFDPQCWNWLVAADVLVPVEEKIDAHAPLKRAIAVLEQMGLTHLPVVDVTDSDVPLGIVDLQRIRTIVNERLIKARAVA